MDKHLITLITIMICSGGFGGFLNYLHKFDTTEKDAKDNLARTKYILLGIGSAFLVPAFLKMISSNLVNSKADFDNNDYLIFAGFCLIAAIFSRRFITSIGEKILEAAKNAEKTSHDNRQKIETTQLELTSTQDRIETVKLAVDLKSKKNVVVEETSTKQKELLIELADSYIEKTSVPDYSQRVKLKAELGRKMGEIIVRNNLSKDDLFKSNQSEGMLLALSYSVQLDPDEEGLHILNKISKFVSQLYTKYSILVSYDTLARNNFIKNDQAPEVFQIVKNFRTKADSSLSQKIEDSLNILKFIDTSLKE